MPLLLIPRSPAHILSTVGDNAVYRGRAQSSSICFADMLFESLPSGRLSETGVDKDESRGWDLVCWWSDRTRRDLS